MKQNLRKNYVKLQPQNRPPLMIPWKQELRKFYVIRLISKVYHNVEVWDEWSRFILEGKPRIRSDIRPHIRTSVPHI